MNKKPKQNKELISPPNLLLAHTLKSKIKYQFKCSQKNELLK